LRITGLLSFLDRKKFWENSVAKKKKYRKKEKYKHAVTQLGWLLEPENPPERMIQFVLARHRGKPGVWCTYAVNSDSRKYYTYLFVLSAIAHRHIREHPTDNQRQAPEFRKELDDCSFGQVVRYLSGIASKSAGYATVDSFLRQNVRAIFERGTKEGKHIGFVGKHDPDTFKFGQSSKCPADIFHGPYPREINETDIDFSQISIDTESIHHLAKQLYESKLWQQWKNEKKGRPSKRTKLPLSDYTKSFRPFIKNRTEGFVGRVSVFEDILDFVQGKQCGYFLIQGDPGIGKSSIAAKLVEDHQYVHHFNMRAQGIDTVEAFLENICAQLTHKCKLKDRTLPANLSAYGNFLGTLLSDVSNTLSSREKAVIVIDAIEEIDTTGLRPGTNPLFLPHTLPPGVFIVITMRTKGANLKIEGDWKEVNITHNLPENQEDIRKYLRPKADSAEIRSYMEKHGLSPVSFVELLLRKSEGNFMYLRHVLPEIECGTYRDLRVDLLPTGLVNYYEDHWQRMGMTSKLPGTKAEVIYILSEVRSPVSWKLLADFAGKDEVTVQAVLNEWRQFLHVQVVDGEKRFSLYHASFLEFLRRQDIVDVAGITVDGINRMIGRSLYDEFVGTRCLLRQPDYMPTEKCLHALRSLPAHLSFARMWTELEAVLCDIEFLEAKVEAGLTLDLANNFTQATTRLPPHRPQYRIVRRLEEAIRRDASFIHRHPSTLFQCLWNTCWWYDCPQAAGHYPMPESGWHGGKPPWKRTGPKLHKLLERWRCEKGLADPDFTWMRAIRPPSESLGAAGKIVLRGAEGATRSLAFCPSQEKIVCGADGVVRVWDLRTGAEVVEFENDSAVLCVASAPDGREVVYGTTNGRVMAWKYAEDPHPICIFEHDEPVVCVKYSHKGDVIASLSEYKITFCKVASKEVVKTISGAGIGFKYLDISFDDSFLATVQSSSQIGIWDITDGRLVNSFAGHGKQRDEWLTSLTSVAFSPNGKWLASCADDGKVRLWDSSIGEQLACFKGHNDRVTCISFTRDGDYLISGAWDHTVRIWDLERQKQLRKCPVAYSVNCIDISSDDQLVACGSHNVIEVWNPHQDSEQLLCRDHGGPFWLANFTPDYKHVFTGSDDGSVRLCDLGDGEEKQHTSHMKARIKSFAVAPSGARVGFGLSNSSVWLWNARSGEEPMRLEGETSLMYRLAFALNGVRLVGASTENELLIWETSHGHTVAHLAGLTDAVRAFEVSPSGDCVVVGLRKGRLSVLDARNGAVRWKLTGHRHPLNTVKFSPDSNFVAIGSKDGSIQFRRVSDGKLMRSLSHDRQPIKDLALSKDSGWIAWILEDGSVRVSDLASKKAVVPSIDVEKAVDEIAFASDGSGLLIGRTRPTVWVWDIHTGQCIECFEGVNDLGIVNGPTKLARYVPLQTGIEIGIYDRYTKTCIAWLDQNIRVVLAHPSGELWICAYDTRHLGIFSLEGKQTSN